MGAQACSFHTVTYLSIPRPPHWPLGLEVPRHCISAAASRQQEKQRRGERRSLRTHTSSADHHSAVFRTLSHQTPGGWEVGAAAPGRAEKANSTEEGEQ